MDKKEIRIRSKLARMTDLEKDELLFHLFSEEDMKNKMQIVEDLLGLVTSDPELDEKYGVYAEEYYKLPIDNRVNICELSHKYFLKNGNYDINDLTMSIAREAELAEANNIVDAMNEVRELKKQNPEINVEGIRTEDPIIAAIRENNKLYDERPKINFKGVKYDI